MGETVMGFELDRWLMGQAARARNDAKCPTCGRFVSFSRWYDRRYCSHCNEILLLEGRTAKVSS